MMSLHAFIPGGFSLAVIGLEREEESYIMNRVTLFLSFTTDDIQDAAA